MCTRIRKGIINPNYPGFQSLAYTLNDDHFDYSSENPSDDEEDSYVSESDDNELKRRGERDGVGDENGNSYAGSDERAENEHRQAGDDSIPVVSTGGQEALHGSTLHHTGEKTFGSSPARRSRMRVIPTGCRSPTSHTTTGTMIEAEEKLGSGGTYACTPPDILLQHSCELRPAAFGATHEQLMASLELSNSQRPDLIPEHQLLEQEQKKNELNRQEFHAPSVEQLAMKHPTIDEEPLGEESEDDEAVDDVDDDDDDDDDDDEGGNEEEDEMERNHTPPSPAIERAIGTVSMSNSSTSSSHFLRNVTLSPDLMLDDGTRCYGSASDATLSDDSDHSDPESDEMEFGYRPYEGGEPRDGYQRTPDVAGTPDSGGDSAGSSPGEVQYHLVDDCSNQTVQITRSRQSGDHSPTKQYHALLQHYSSLGPAGFCADQARLGEHEINCNDRYPSMEGLAQTAEQVTHAGGYGAVVPFQGEAISTDYPDVRPQALSFHRKDADMSSQDSHNAHPIASSLEEKRNIIGETMQSNVDTLGPNVVARQYQKVPKVNPFCELLLQENDTCDFFTKQAKLQIEARMALCQAKDMAHMQMEIEKRSLPLSPVTQVIHTAVEKAGLCLAADKRRLSRYYLTRLNLAQLRTILLELQGHAEVLNEELVQLLMERDELHISQDATLIDIEDLSRYLCAKEQTIMHAERQRKSYHWNSSKTIYHPIHQMQPSHPQPPQMRTQCGGQSTVPAYRYH